MQSNVLTRPEPTKGEYLDRKRTLPRRVVKICYSLARLKPGRYIYIVNVPHEGDLQFEQGVLQSA